MDIDTLIALALGNVPIIGLALAFVVPLCVEARLTAQRQLSYLLLLGLGLPLLWAAWWHLARPAEAARLIGFAPSPFQREVGLADLAMGLVACVAPTRPLPFRGAIVWTLAIALLGDAAGHIREMVETQNFAPGNAGSILWWDVIAPLAALVLLFAAGRPARSRDEDLSASSRANTRGR